MNSFNFGPEWSGKDSQSKQTNSSNLASSQKSDSVKSKLRQLAEFRSRSKEFGSNDSLHLTPSNRSLSDPWLMKGDFKEMDSGLDLTKGVSGSTSNLTKEKNKYRTLPVMSNGLSSAGLPVMSNGLSSAGLPVMSNGLSSAGLPVMSNGLASVGLPVMPNGLSSAGSESHINTLWQQQLELMHKSVNAYQKMASYGSNSALFQNPYLPYSGYGFYDYPDTGKKSSKKHVEKAPEKNSLQSSQHSSGQKSANNTQQNLNNYAQNTEENSLNQLSKYETQQLHHETTVHWKPSIDNINSAQNHHSHPSHRNQELMLSPNQDMGKGQQLRKQEPMLSPNQVFGKGQQQRKQEPMLSPYQDFGKGQQQRKQEPVLCPYQDFGKGQQLIRQEPMLSPKSPYQDFGKGQQQRKQEPMLSHNQNFGKGQQLPLDFSQANLNQSPVDFSKHKQKASIYFPMEFNTDQHCSSHSKTTGNLGGVQLNGNEAISSNLNYQTHLEINTTNYETGHSSDKLSTNPQSLYLMDSPPFPNKEVKKKQKLNLESELKSPSQENRTLQKQGDMQNGQYPYMPYPFLPNYYSDPHMMKALMAHQKMYTENAIGQPGQKLKRKSSSKDVDGKKVKRTKKSGEKLNKKGEQIINMDKKVCDSQTKSKSKILSMDIKKSLQANSVALNQIQSRVQEILNSAAKEMKQGIKSGIDPSTTDVEMDADFLDAHEQLLNPGTDNSNSTINNDNFNFTSNPCCNNCEKLGQRYSPLCEEKSKRSSVSDLPELISDNKNISLDFSVKAPVASKVTDNSMSDKSSDSGIRHKVINASSLYDFEDDYSDMKTDVISSSAIIEKKAIPSTYTFQPMSQSSAVLPTFSSLFKSSSFQNSQNKEKERKLTTQVTCKSDSSNALSKKPSDMVRVLQASPDKISLGNMSNGLENMPAPTEEKNTGSNNFINNFTMGNFSNFVPYSTSSNLEIKHESSPVSSASVYPVSSSNTSASCSNYLDYPITPVINSDSNTKVSEQIAEEIFKAPNSAKSSVSAISRLEKNLSSLAPDRSFENDEMDEKLEDLSLLLDFENSDDEKENLFKNSTPKSIGGDGDLLLDMKPGESIPESGLDQLAWVADQVQKIKTKITGADDEDDDDLTTRLQNNTKIEMPQCGCRGPGYTPTEEVEGPYYTHLGAARSVQAVRELLEKRTGMTGKAIRIEKIRYTGKEGKSSQGCPIAKWIIRRSSEDEKYLCVIKQRPGHFCDTAWIIVVLVAWEGIENNTAADMYDYLRNTLAAHGFETERRCGTNERKTCACQGINLGKRGASFSFGCSWSMYFNGCKFARSQTARKFKLKDSNKEEELETKFQELATDVAPLYKQIAPDAYHNQVAFEDKARDCRLGFQEGRPFSGVTSCIDFCAHAHKDLHNMNNGSTVVVTLTKHRGLEKAEDEQLHVLPLYVMDMSDEYGSADAQYEKVKTGALEILNYYQMEARIRATPLTPSRKKKKDGKKGSPGRKKGSVNKNNSSPVTPKRKVVESTQDSNISSDLYYNGEKHGSNSGTPQKTTPLKTKKSSKSLSSKTSYEELMNNASQPGFADLYDSFWNYFYSFGSFPPADFMASMNMKAQSLIKKSKDLNQTSENRQPSLDMNGISPQIESSYLNSHNQENHHDLKNIQTSSILKSQEKAADDTFHNPSHPFQFPQCNSFENKKYQDEQSVKNQINAHELSGQIANGDTEKMCTNFTGIVNEIQNASGYKNGAIEQNTSNVDGQHTTLPVDLSNKQQPYINPYSGKDNSFQNSDTSSRNYELKQNAAFESPLHLLSEAVSMRTNEFSNDFSSQDLPQNTQPYHLGDSSLNKNVQNGQRTGQNDYMKNCISESVQNPFNPMQTNSVNLDADIDQNILKCEIEYNENAFRDQNVGGVAIALGHGSVLFEVAKHELHATTGLKQPNRHSPTRISLVFYQHKNMNYKHHGMFMYEKKCERVRQKRLQDLMNGTGEKIPDSVLEKAMKGPGKKKKSKKEEKFDIMKTSAAQYKYMWDTTTARSETMTTESVVTHWVKPQPMVTGPYQRWI
ncbi:methylcytosine dioxygenase tet3-like isoform X1 [Mytilus californianus]|uniref:methylcytosine dioxygenase tet3-like isoform X1 n=2 Tax=Mytilus californianus TaxID=6549 RepID=UPI002247CD3D|nr:methylcytosine dioxygenase tet3-like isoform X1 [Mytilus californianus]